MTNQSNPTIADEDKEIEQIIAARTSVAAALDKNKLLDVLRSIVDGSDCLDFVSARTRRYISPGRPELILLMDLEKAAAKYPKLSVMDADIDSIRTGRSKVVQAEISSPLVDFFTAVFKYILTDSVPEHYSQFEEQVVAIISNTTTEELRDRILNIFNIKDRETGQVTDELGFMFAVTTAVALPEDSDLLTDFTVSVELVY